jgi:hypothetical protein
VGSADALASLLLTVGVAAPKIPPGLEARAARWRDVVAGKKVLLLLDDPAGHERAGHQPPSADRAGGRRRTGRLRPDPSPVAARTDQQLA